MDEVKTFQEIKASVAILALAYIAAHKQTLRHQAECGQCKNAGLDLHEFCADGIKFAFTECMAHENMVGEHGA